MTTSSSLGPWAPTIGPLAGIDARRVAVFRALRLGDMLCAVPALRALRRALPRARVTLVGLPWARQFAERFPHYVDDFLALPGVAGLPEQPPDPAGWPTFVAAARARRFDLAIQMHGSGRITHGLVRHLGARVQAGFVPAGSSALLLQYPDEGPEPLRLLRLMAHLGAGEGDARLEYPLRPEDDDAWLGHPAVRALVPGRYLCLHPGARAPARRWPPSRFAAVGDALARESGLAVVLTGSAEESALTQAVARAMRSPAVDAAAPVPVGALAALIGRARLLVGNDTGTSHLAAALGVASVIVFRASDMARWAPLDTGRHRAVWDPRARRIDAVLSAARELLSSSRPRDTPRAPAR